MFLEVDEAKGGLPLAGYLDPAAIDRFSDELQDPVDSLICLRLDAEVALDLRSGAAQINPLVDGQQEVHERVVASEVLPQLKRAFDRLQIGEARIRGQDSDAHVLLAEFLHRGASRVAVDQDA